MSLSFMIAAPYRTNGRDGHLSHFQAPFCVHNYTSEKIHISQNTPSFLPGIQICLLIVVFILPAVLGLTTTRMI